MKTSSLKLFMLLTLMSSMALTKSFALDDMTVEVGEVIITNRGPAVDEVASPATDMEFTLEEADEATTQAENANQEEVAQEVAQEEVAQEEVAQEEVAQEEVAPEEVAPEVVAPEVVAQEESTNQGEIVIQEEVVAQDEAASEIDFRDDFAIVSAFVNNDDAASTNVITNSVNALNDLLEIHVAELNRDDRDSIRDLLEKYASKMDKLDQEEDIARVASDNNTSDTVQCGNNATVGLDLVQLMLAQQNQMNQMLMMLFTRLLGQNNNNQSEMFPTWANYNPLAGYVELMHGQVMQSLLNTPSPLAAGNANRQPTFQVLGDYYANGPFNGFNNETIHNNGFQPNPVTGPTAEMFTQLNGNANPLTTTFDFNGVNESARFMN